VIDATSPTIQIISPQPGETFPPNKPIWINATITDNLAVNATTINLTLNNTKLTPSYNPTTGLLSYQQPPLPEGIYTINLTVEDIAGNKAIKTWNFTSSISPPTVTIDSPTTENPTYTQSSLSVNITVTYTELNPLNETITIYNSTTIIAEWTNQTALTSGTNTATIQITIPSWASDGKYNVNATMFNTYNLSTTATQENAIIIDNTPPVISNPYQSPPGQIIQPNTIVNVDAGQNVIVTINISEPYLDTVTLSYKINETQWIDIPMNHTTGNEYTATIPSSNLPVGANVTYYITATDKAGNTAKTPTNGIYFQYSIVPEFTTLTMLIILLISTILAVAINRKRKP
ncbi:hypothetical protein J7L49_02145, partial [Candidatus Bathyarchaeota archaeon]|nr:hypothetical protein [Candidatus Bathyarchaeota archaeon]